MKCFPASPDRQIHIKIDFANCKLGQNTLLRKDARKIKYEEVCI
jgi:hypothetical protein